MTITPLTFDDGSYSTRVCRCGTAMLRTTGTDRSAWRCATCGRQSKS